MAPRWRRAPGNGVAAVLPDLPEPPATVAPGLEDQGRTLLALDRHGRNRLRRILGDLDVDDPGILPSRRRLLKALIDMAGKAEADTEAGVLPNDPADPMHPLLRLLDTCLDHLPDILMGRKSEAELLFGDGSQDLVGAAYRQGPASFYNGIAAERIAALAAELGCCGRVRMLEVGAGTGATTGPVLAALGATVDYVYTDISSHFVNHGRSTFGPSHPSTVFRTLDIERDPAEQGFEPGSFDLVLAANVVHATRDVGRTLTHAKRLLRTGGVLVLSETVTCHDFLTLTFGLTEGWWRFEDAERRLSHAPLLDYRGWSEALHEAGFIGVSGFGPVRDAAGVPTGHAIVVAHSDGWLRQLPEAEMTTAPAALPSDPPAIRDDGPGSNVVSYLRSVLCKVLKIDPADLDDDLEFEAYGIDSLVAIDLLSRMERDLGSLPKTLFLEYNTVSRLAVRLKAPEFLKAPEIKPSAPSIKPVAQLVLPIRAEGTKPPSFWVPSVLGEIGWTFRLAHHLGKDWPVHAFHARRADGGLPATLEELASRYADAILEAHPTGPYVVGGYSLGGCVAFETVRHLLAAGAEVDRLVLLDSYAPGSNMLRSLLAVPFGDFVLPNMVNLMAQQWNGTALLDPKALPLGDARARLTAAAEHLLAVCRPPYGRDEMASLIGENLEAMQALTDLTARYRPAPLDAPVRTVLFRCSGGFTGPASAFDLDGARIGAPEPDHGWGTLLRDVEIQPIATDHFGLVLEPAIADVARQLAGSGAPADTDADTDERKARIRIFDVVRSHVLAVLVDVAPEAVTPEARLRDLGASSIDRVEVATLAMEELNAEVPRTRLAAVDSLSTLVDALYEHGGGR
jgi:thioesterase domain-containing protein/acyl carrier protein/SAM-dependent methyltransferase